MEVVLGFLVLFSPALAREEDTAAALRGARHGAGEWPASDPEVHPRRLQVATSTSQAEEDFSTVVPSCRPGYIDVTGGKAYQWTCAFYCEGGQNFATKSCLCACLTQEQIEKLGLSASTTSTANYAAQGHSILVTQAPDTEGKVPERVEEVPVGEVHDGPMENLHGQTSGDYVAAASGSTTAPPPVVPPAAYSWQTVLLVLTGAFLIIVAVSMVLVFAHRNGFLGALQVVKTSNLDHVDVTNRPSDVRLSPDKLSCLRRDSQLAAACMSPKAVVAMDHLEKLRNSGDAAAKQAANYHLDSLHIARTPSCASDSSRGTGKSEEPRAPPELAVQRRRSAPETELPMQRRKSAPDHLQEPELPVQRRNSAPDHLQAPRIVRVPIPASEPSVVMLASQEQLQMLRTPSKVSNASSQSCPQRLAEHLYEEVRRPSSASATPPVASMAKDRLAATWKSSHAVAAAKGGCSPSQRQSSRLSQHSASSAQTRSPQEVPSSPSRSRRGSKVSQVHPGNLRC